MTRRVVIDVPDDGEKFSTSTHPASILHRITFGGVNTLGAA
jgi:hypothetical protein